MKLEVGCFLFFLFSVVPRFVFLSSTLINFQKLLGHSYVRSLLHPKVSSFCVLVYSMQSGSSTSYEADASGARNVFATTQKTSASVVGRHHMHTTRSSMLNTDAKSHLSNWMVRSPSTSMPPKGKK